eukprot:TRINITY_DN27584_c0_g1_i1.p1 TRINITY_DN27584_c0_g1~~TRINITY_DN27584_c0_g1_i1.p1  ORF type:complete len:964 (+),score=247.16 TRINITY_DN27584_c0_g1_i1:147-3038(+)
MMSIPPKSPAAPLGFRSPGSRQGSRQPLSESRQGSRGYDSRQASKTSTLMNTAASSGSWGNSDDGAPADSTVDLQRGRRAYSVWLPDSSASATGFAEGQRVQVKLIGNETHKHLAGRMGRVVRAIPDEGGGAVGLPPRVPDPRVQPHGVAKYEVALLSEGDTGSSPSSTLTSDVGLMAVVLPRDLLVPMKEIRRVEEIVMVGRRVKVQPRQASGRQRSSAAFGYYQRSADCGVVTGVDEEQKTCAILLDGATEVTTVETAKLTVLEPAAEYPPEAKMVMCHLADTPQYHIEGKAGIVVGAGFHPRLGVAVTVRLRDDPPTLRPRMFSWRHVHVDGKMAPPCPPKATPAEPASYDRLAVGKRVTIVNLEYHSDPSIRSLAGRTGFVRSIHAPSAAAEHALVHSTPAGVADEPAKALESSVAGRPPRPPPGARPQLPPTELPAAASPKKRLGFQKKAHLSCEGADGFPLVVSSREDWMVPDPLPPRSPRPPPATAADEAEAIIVVELEETAETWRLRGGGLRIYGSAADVTPPVQTAAAGAAGAVYMEETVALPESKVSEVVKLCAGGRAGAASPQGSPRRKHDPPEVRKYQVGEGVVVVGCPSSDANGCRGVVHAQAGELVWVDFGELRGVLTFRTANVRDQHSVEVRDSVTGEMHVFTVATDGRTVLLETPATGGAILVTKAERLTGLVGTETVTSIAVNRCAAGGGGGLDDSVISSPLIHRISSVDTEGDPRRPPTPRKSVSRTSSVDSQGRMDSPVARTGRAAARLSPSRRRSRSAQRSPSPSSTAVTLRLPQETAGYLVHRLGRLFGMHGVTHDLPCPSSSEFPHGARVAAHGLLALPSLNGAKGRVMGVKSQGGQLLAVQVDFGGERGRMFIRPENLDHVVDAPDQQVAPPVEKQRKEEEKKTSPRLSPLSSPRGDFIAMRQRSAAPVGSAGVLRRAHSDGAVITEALLEGLQSSMVTL